MTNDQRDAIRDYLAALYAKHGRLTPALVVRDAKRPNSILHPCFEWDDGEAAGKWREEQARVLIRSIRVTITTDTSIIESVAYVRDPNVESDEQGYVSVESLRGNRKAAREALAYESSRAEALLERARNLAVALGLAKVADKAIGSVRTLRERAVATVK